MQSLSISDVTIKTADTSSAFSLSFKEKIELAKLLDRLNVSVIEVGELRSRKIDSLLVKSIASAVRQSAVAVPVTLEEDSVAVTWAALKEARRPRLQLKAPMSPAMSGRTTSRPSSRSKARSMASLWKVPPCTTTFCPSSSAEPARMTL